MLIGVVGDYGVGKTITGVYLTAEYAASEKNVYSNIELKGIPYTYVWAIRQMNEMRDGVFLFDEIWTWLDSRSSTQERNKLSSVITAKTRKRGFDIIWTAQMSRLVELRQRNLTERFLLPHATPRINPRIVRVACIDRYGVPVYSFAFNPKPIYPLYDSYADISMPAEFYEDAIRRQTKKRVLLEYDEYVAMRDGKMLPGDFA